jgi:ribosomal protein S18 acetylase RimI-like enzyme
LEGVRIRRGTGADQAFFRDLEMQTTWENLPPEDCRRLDQEQVWLALDETHEILLARPGNVIFIAEVDGERAGLLWFGSNRNLVTGEEEGWIYNVTVLPAYRGRGIGRMLMRHAETHAGEQGYAVIGLMVAVHNSVARELYHRLDYQDSNILMRKQLPALSEEAPAADPMPSFDPPQPR